MDFGGVSAYVGVSILVASRSDPPLPRRLFAVSFEKSPLAVECPRGPFELGDVKMTVGTVKFFNSAKGFGFIAPEGGAKDVFVHVSAVERAGLSGLADGQRVSFDLERDRQGRDSATNLKTE